MNNTFPDYKRRLFCALASAFLATGLSVATQKPYVPAADIKVSYDWNYYGKRGGLHKTPMVLLSGSKASKFYEPIGEYTDSLRSTPEGLEKFKQMTVAYFQKRDMARCPKKAIYLYVVKDFDKRISTTYDGDEGDHSYSFKCEENLDGINRETGDSTKDILGYECILASVDYHGRHWSVWFSPEIPVNDGPWKLWGLPELVLEAEDSTGQHSFKATGIEKSSKPIEIIVGPWNYETTTGKDMYSRLRNFMENPLGSLNASTGGGAGISAEEPIDEKCNFLEADYR